MNHSRAAYIVTAVRTAEIGSEDHEGADLRAQL
jgi:hypothetical protein